MSRRAAARLESFGFKNVCAYVPGKQDWLAFGLPFEGSLAKVRTAGNSALTDVPVCGAQNMVADVLAREENSGWQECVVLNENRVVLGLLTKGNLHADSHSTVEQAMDRAPLSVRPHTPWEATIKKMRSQSVAVAVVTTPDGKLLGVVKESGTK